MVLFIGPIPIAAFALIVVQRRSRRRGEDLPVAAAIGTGIVLALVAALAGSFLVRFL